MGVYHDDDEDFESIDEVETESISAEVNDLLDQLQRYTEVALEAASDDDIKKLKHVLIDIKETLKDISREI